MQISKLANMQLAKGQIANANCNGKRQNAISKRQIAKGKCKLAKGQLANAFINMKYCLRPIFISNYG